MASIVLDPTRTYEELVIGSSNILVEGNGARVIGAEGAGAGVRATGISGVTLRNLRVHRFETGLQLTDCSTWLIEGCDLSDNFHDPTFGWGENGRRGGLVLAGCRRCELRANRANRVWDACTLFESDDNLLNGNDFSHTSNTGLRLWQSSGNVIRGNNLSHGLRIAPGEVHARDSCGLLVEHGSNRNVITANDARYSGDGIFIRCLNGVPSSGNYLQGNDASHAHNNCIEALAPGNTFVANVANHGSYGFWLGGSDGAILIDNEASHNGLTEGHHNAPEASFGHGGIVFTGAPARHVVLDGNHCEQNNGAGVAFRGRPGLNDVHHILLRNNVLRGNHFGLYLESASRIALDGNQFASNVRDIEHGGGVEGLYRF